MRVRLRGDDRVGERFLRAIPRSCWTWNYTVVDEATPVARIETSWFRGRVTLTVLGVPYRVYRERTRRGACVLESDGAVLARATPDNVPRAFAIEHAAGWHAVRGKSRAGRDCVLVADGQEIGTIQPEGRFNRRVRARVPDCLPLPLGVFCIWLVLRIWQEDGDMLDHPPMPFE
jgi:hypothetical protein